MLLGPHLSKEIKKLFDTMWKPKGTIVASWPSERRAVAKATQSLVALERFSCVYS